MIDELVLANGEPYDHGKGLTITAFTGLLSERRFPGLNFGERFSVSDHSMVCALLSAKYHCHFNLTIPLDRFVVLCLFHDIHEAVMGDIPTPSKTQDQRDMEDRIQTECSSYLFGNKNYLSMSDIEFLHVDNVDKVAGYVELAMYSMNIPQHPGIVAKTKAFEKYLTDRSILEFAKSCL